MRSFLRVRRLRAVFVSILLALAVSSCAHTPWKRNVVSSANGVAIFRERRFDDSGKEVRLGHSHPINLSPEQLRRVLGALSYTRAGWLSDTTGKVVAPEVLERLSGQVSKALEDLSPDERLRFLAVREKGVLFLNRHVGTSGVVFAPNDAEVTVAFDPVDDTIVADGGDPESVRFYYDPMQLADPGFQLHLPEPLIAPLDGGKPAPPSNRFTFDAQGIASLPAPQTPAGDAGTEARDKPAEPPRPIEQAAANAPTFDFAYKGFSVVAYRSRYYGIAASEGKFDPAKLKAGTYKTLFERGSVDEVIAAIDAIVEGIKDR